MLQATVAAGPELYAATGYQEGEAISSRGGLSSGNRLESFRLLELRGQGAFGEVWLGVDLERAKLVAIKCAFLSLRSTGVQQQFDNEVAIGERLTHDALVCAWAHGQLLNTLFLVMEFIDAHSLEQRMATTQGLEWREAVTIVAEACHRVQKMHEQGVIHCDLKPANILHTPEMGVKIVDFGISRCIDEPDSWEEGKVFGTPLYMSPEQATGKLPDVRSDIYSLGVVLFYLATGAHPICGSDNLDTLRAHREDEPRLLRQMHPDLPEELEVLVSRSLAKDRGQRFQTASEFGDALDGLLAA